LARSVNDRAASNDRRQSARFHVFFGAGDVQRGVAGIYTFRIGDREAGTILDRFVLQQRESREQSRLRRRAEFRLRAPSPASLSLCSR
jgi:hypothetical protein